MAMVSDVDRGWAFVVMLSGCLSQALTLGLTYTSAVFYVTFLNEFQRSPVLTAWTVNLNVFAFYLTGELSGILVAVFGPRVTVACGCLLSTMGLLGCYFADDLMTILGLFGVVTGVGFSCVYFPVFAVIASYFKKYRSMAFAVSSSGAGLGQFVYPPLLKVCIDAYLWRGAFLILAAVNLHGLVIAATLMPARGSPESEVAEEGGNAVRKQLKRQARYLLILRRPRVFLWCFSSILINVGISGFYTHITSYARILGFSSLQATFLPSVVGISGLLGRVVMGIFIGIKRIHAVGLYIFLFSILGVAALLTAASSSYPAVLASCILCGIGVGAYGVYPEAIIHIVGVDHLAALVSYSSLCSAVGMLTGGPLAAWVFEADPSYRWSYVTVGLIAIVGAQLNLPSWCEIRKGRLVQRKSAEVDRRFSNHGTDASEEEGDEKAADGLLLTSHRLSVNSDG